mgnify:CR=1 FL=1
MLEALHLAGRARGAHRHYRTRDDDRAARRVRLLHDLRDDVHGGRRGRGHERLARARGHGRAVLRLQGRVGQEGIVIGGLNHLGRAGQGGFDIALLSHDPLRGLTGQFGRAGGLAGLHDGAKDFDLAVGQAHGGQAYPF